MKLFDVYPLLPVTPVSAHGCIVVDKSGVEYLDFYGGHAVISIGHNHPHYNEMLKEQLSKIAFYSNAVTNPLQEELAFRLGKISGWNNFQLFLCNSGAEANENALKVASFVNGRKKIVSFTGSFHGRTSAAVAATHDPAICSMLNMQHEVNFCQLNDYEEAERMIDDETCAVIIEGIQGVAGVIEPESEFLQHIEVLCQKTGALLILDEVQSGCGRTGDYFAHEYAGIVPDMVTMAKGIGNGFPIGAVFIAPHIQPSQGMLGTTFGGNYLACAAALAVVDVIESDKLLQSNATFGDVLADELRKMDGVTDITGRGLMLGIHYDQPVALLRKQLLLEHHIFTGSSSDPNTIRLLPPYCITQKEIKQVVNAFAHISIPQPA